MQNITITVSADGRKCHLKPESGHMLQRGVCPNLYSEADGVKNTQRELSQWRAVNIMPVTEESQPKKKSTKKTAKAS